MNGNWLRKPSNGTAIVFVHGILAKEATCWRHKNGSYWPQLLKDETELRSSGIFVFSYPTDMFSGSFCLGDIVNTLQDQLRHNKAAECKKLIFVCHSMGGIVVRKFLVDQQIELFRNRQEIGLFLVASPSLGSSYADWLSPLAKILGHEQAHTLRFVRNNPWLQDLDEHFINLKEAGNLKIYGKEIYEDRPFFKSPVFTKLFGRQVVEPFSAARYFADSRKIYNSDHFTIAEPKDRDDEQHRLLCQFIKDTLSASLQPPSEVSPGTGKGEVVPTLAGQISSNGQENLPVVQKSRIAGTLPPICNVPRRNPNFTGREDILEQLRHSLVKDVHIALTQQALHGLGGIGKTQLAIEYAYRHSAEYEVIWWIRSAEPSTLFSDYAELAAELNLHEKDAPEQEKIIQAVRKWLDHHSNWLLVFDNAVDVVTISNFLPKSSGGHVLITSRNEQWSTIIIPLEIKVWNREESVAFLNKRTGQHDDKAANGIAAALGDLPLALEQAAAYCRTMHISYVTYLELFTIRRKDLWKAEQQPYDYPSTVAATWELAFTAIKDVLFAKDILNLCTLFAPDAIPRTLITTALGYHASKSSDAAPIDSMKINAAVAALSNYSLVSAETETISIHRLVQAVAQDRMDGEEIASFRTSAINALTQLFPDEGYKNPACWSECAALMPHAETVVNAVVNDDRAGENVSDLLNNMGLYRMGRATYVESESLFRRALEIREQLFGGVFPIVATSLTHLAMSLHHQAMYVEAEQLSRRALVINETCFGYEHPEVASDLDHLAKLLHVTGKYSEAELLFRRALVINEKLFGYEHLVIANNLTGLATLLYDKSMYAEAELLHCRALAIREKLLGSEHQYVAESLNNYALLLLKQKKYEKAELFLRRGLAICEKILGHEHPDIATCLNNLSFLLQVQGNYAGAEPLSRRSLAICEKILGHDHPQLAASLQSLVSLLIAQGRYVEAEPLNRRALQICEKVLGNDHPHVMSCLGTFADLLYAQGKYSEAEPIYRRILVTQQNTYGNEDHSVTTPLNNLALMLFYQGKYIEAESLYRCSLAICEKAFGKEQSVATCLNNLGLLLKTQGKYDDAAPIHRKALSIYEKTLGPDHHLVATSLNNIAELCRAQGKYDEAEPLYHRALMIREKQLGNEHPDVAKSLNNFAELLFVQGRYAEAEPLYRRALVIDETALRKDHPDTILHRNNLNKLLDEMKKVDKV
jgi:tetratricopeptide (TPR) repeat protein